LARFPANVAYTLDGGELGEMHGENFNALNIKLNFQGKSAHTGSARGLMTNALTMAAFFISAIPMHMRPETTSGREGFIHVDELIGNVERAEAEVLLRDFSAAGLQAKKDMIATCCRLIEQAFPHGSVTSEEIRGYRNMKETLKKDSRIIEFLKQAISESNIDPVVRAIRGGTDGAELSAQGLPTPNIFVGGGGFHSRTEWASLQWMGKAVEVAVRLIGLWGTTAQTSKP
jgi:tripeptide aminopeptidase